MCKLIYYIYLKVLLDEMHKKLNVVHFLKVLSNLNMAKAN